MDNSDTERINEDVLSEGSLAPKEPKSFLKERIISGLILMLYVLANIGTVPLVSQYIHARFEEELGYNVSNVSKTGGICNQGNRSSEDDIQLKIQQKTSFELLKLSLAIALPPVIVNMVLGSYSDNLGRRLLFVLPILGSICKYTIIVLVVTLGISVHYLLIGALLDGLSGGFCTFTLANLAYAADVTPKNSERTLAMVITETTISAAVAGGQILNGFLIDHFGFFYPAITSVVCLLLALLMVTIGLTETVKVTKDQNFLPWIHIKKVFSFYTRRTEDNTRCLFLLCILTFFLVSISNNGRYSIETLYQLNSPFCWDALTIGYYGALSTLFQLLCGLVAAKWLSLCVKAEILGVIGLIMVAGSQVLEGLATNNYMLYGVPLVAGFSSMSNPVIRSIMSRMAGPTQQGALFSSLASMDTLCNAIGSATFTAVYSATLRIHRGIAFLVVAGILLIAALINLITVRKLRGRIEYEVVVAPPGDDMESHDERDTTRIVSI